MEHRLFSFDRYEYDVKLAGWSAGVIPTDHTHRAMWESLLKKRIDVVAWTGEQPTILEVKPVASFAALGQCLGYGFLWAAEKPGLRKARLGVVCARVDPDLSACFSAYGVRVWQLPPDVGDQLLTASHHRASGAAR